MWTRSTGYLTPIPKQIFYKHSDNKVNSSLVSRDTLNLAWIVYLPPPGDFIRMWTRKAGSSRKRDIDTPTTKKLIQSSKRKYWNSNVLNCWKTILQLKVDSKEKTWNNFRLQKIIDKKTLYQKVFKEYKINDNMFIQKKFWGMKTLINNKL